MFTFATRFYAATCLALIAGVAIATDDAPKKRPPPRTDLYGDPLPDGAVARLGSVRLRHAGLSDFVFLNGGKSILSAGSDRTLRFWDVATGQQTRAVKLQGLAGPGHVVTLSPDGKTLVAHDKEKLVFWDVESGKEIKTLPGSKGHLGYLYFSPDGKTLAVGRSDWRVSFWEWETGKECVATLPLRPQQLMQFNMDSTFHGSFSADGKWFVAGAQSQQPLGVFEVQTGREILRVECNPGTSSISPDGTRLAVSSWKGEVGKRETVLRFFELPSGKETALFSLGHDVPYYTLAFSRDGKKLACSRSDRGCIVDCASGRVLQNLPGRPWELAFAPDGNTLVFSSGYRLNVWDMTQGKELNDRPGDFGSSPAIAVSPCGRLLAAGDWIDRAVSLWDLSNGRLVRQFPLTGKQERYVRNLRFSADGQTLMACQASGFLRFWDVATGKQRRTIQLRDPNQPNPDDAYFYHLHLSADGKHVATFDRILSRDSATRLALWGTDTGMLLSQQAFPGELRLGAWSADAMTVAVPVKDVLTLADVKTGEARFQFPGIYRGPISRSPDDRLLAAARTTVTGKDESVSVAVWEIATGKEVAAVPTGRVTHLAVAPDNRHLVTSDENFLRVWDLGTGQERRRWSLPVAGTDAWGRTFVFALDLIPDGQRAVTVVADGTALIWDLASAFHSAQPLAKQTGDKEIAAWWADLADKDPARAYAAVWRLTEAPEASAVAFLRQHLKPVADPDFDKMRRLIADLDSDAFKGRENANKQLEDLGKAAAPALRMALAKGPALEAQRRLEKLLARTAGLVPLPESLQQLRGIQVLERMASTDARRLLVELANGMAHADETLEAKRSLERLSRRTVTP
jgi:WD40 repeat protein